ncbi:MAG: sulfite exporter TauE/SafE family protein [Bacteroidales bacterium]|nr:MAG: sulfite exporter TauE/SafE family protein [Bacteroidales bacterium]
MNEQILVLAINAASLGFIHTVLGPDHYLPFIVLAKARRWSTLKTGIITLLCGLGHVGSSIIVGVVGIALVMGLSKVEGFEGIRGNIAAWAFIAFGFLYMTWGLIRAIKNKPHKHSHFHNGGIVHEHVHTHSTDHDHVHKGENALKLTPWVLFIIFVLGPCEPLIPLLMYPAAEHDSLGVITVSVVFAITTMVTMLVLVLLLTYGLKSLPFGKLERYTHAIAGATIFLSGCAIVFLGL